MENGLAQSNIDTNKITTRNSNVSTIVAVIAVLALIVQIYISIQGQKANQRLQIEILELEKILQNKQEQLEIYQSNQNELKSNIKKDSSSSLDRTNIKNKE